MQSACHSWDACLSFLSLPHFFSWSLAPSQADCLFLFLSLYVSGCVSLCLHLPPTSHLSLSALQHLSINVLMFLYISDVFLVSLFPLPFAHNYSFPCPQWFVDQLFLLQVCIASWLSHCLAESHVFIWYLWEFAAAEGFTLQITPDFHWKDDDLLSFEFWITFLRLPHLFNYTNNTRRTMSVCCFSIVGSRIYSTVQKS